MITAEERDLHVGKRLREIRKANGMSQTTLAKALGITFQQVQKYERASNRISAGKLGQAAEVFDVTPNWFYEGMIIDDELKDFKAQVKAVVDRADERVLEAMLTLLKSK